jgi:hypothetical protein
VKRFVTSYAHLWLAVLLAGLVASAHAAAAPDVQEILRKFTANGEDAELSARRDTIAYQRTSRVEYLNDDGTVKKKQTRIYKVFPEDGRSVTRLVTVNGRAPKEKSDKQRSAARETGEKGRMLTISDDLLSRFDFTFVREEQILGRTNWVLAFAPKSDAPEDEIFDKFINAMTGKLWIDQEEYQLAKAEVRLSKRVAFFGGLAGALDKMDLTLIQRRIEPSVWLGEAVHIDCSGRKLFSTMRFRAFENCSGFEKASGDQARADLPALPSLPASP